jgi:hypothetical protein
MPPHKSLDASGGVIRVMTGLAMLDWIRAAASIPAFSLCQNGER